MNDIQTIAIHFYGSFKQFSKYFNESNQLTLKLFRPCTIADIRTEFNRQLKTHCPEYKEALLSQSIFADNDKVLSETTIIDHQAELHILPPVSGG